MKREPMIIAGNEAISKIRFPIRLLTIALVLTTVTFAGWGWIIFDSLRDAKVLRSETIRIEELRSVIVRLDEALTMSARMAAATGDSQWEDRYRRFEPQLDAAIKELGGFATNSSSGKGETRLDDANSKLVAMEKRAFALVRADHKDEAQAVLVSPEYDTQKQIYSKEITSFINQSRSAFDERLRTDARLGSLLIIAALVVLAISFAAWLSVARGLRLWRSQLLDSFSQLEEARQDLCKAHAALEVRVKERTADLARTNDALQTQARVIESMTEAVIVADEEGRILSTNPACADMFGYERGELIGQHFSVLRNLDEAESRRAVAETMVSMQSGSSWSGEINRRKKDGTPFIARAQISVFEISGKRHFFAVQEDITERKGTDQALKRSEERYRSLFEANPLPMWIYDLETLAFLEVNDAAISHYGYEREEFLSMTIADIRPTADKQALLANVALVEDGAVDNAGIWKHQKKDGSILDVEITSHVLDHKERRAELVLAFDVTKRQRAEAERQVISDIVQGVTTTSNLDELLDLAWRSIGKVLYAENCFVGLHDTDSDLIHFEFWVDKCDSVPPPQPISNGFTRSSYVLRTGQPLLLTSELKAQLFDQGKVAASGSDSASWLGVPLRTPTRTIGVLAVQHYEQEGAYTQRDLEFLSLVGDQIARAIERKQSEQALRESEEKFHQLADNITDVFWITSPDLGTMYYISAGYELIWGRSMASLYAHPHQWIESIIEEDRERVFGVFGTLMGSEPQVSVEYRIARPDGTIRWVHDRGFKVQDTVGNVVRLTGIATDITTRKQASALLMESQQRLALAKEAAHIGIWDWNVVTNELVWDTQMYELYGIQARDFSGAYNAWQNGLHPDDRVRAEAEIMVAVDGGNEFHTEFRVLWPNGEVRDIEAHAVMQHAPNGSTTRMIGVNWDITGRKRTEASVERMNKQLVDASRQAGMAEVATSVLHNVGNVLNSVNVSCSLISEKVRKSRISSVVKIAALLREHAHDLAAFFTLHPTGQKLPNFLGKLSTQLSEEQAAVMAELQLLSKNIEHIKDIVAVQQSHAKNIGGVRETLSLEGLVEDALRMNEAALLHHHVAVLREYGEAPPISMEKHKVLQILMNLVRNAKHALTDSGRADKLLGLRIVRNNGQVAVSVSDNGIGIAPENITRIFAHGFTTRKDGHGFGLHSGVIAAQEMGGSLTAESDGPGAGATFTLKLPVLDYATD